MEDIFVLTEDLIQTINTARQTSSILNDDSADVKLCFDGDSNEMKAGVFFVEECFSIMNALRGKCKTDHFEPGDVDCTTLNYSRNRDQEEKMKKDNFQVASSCVVYHNNKERCHKSKRRDGDDGMKKTKIKVEDGTHDRLMIAAQNRLTREKEKRRAMMQQKEYVAHTTSPKAHTYAARINLNGKMTGFQKSRNSEKFPGKTGNETKMLIVKPETIVDLDVNDIAYRCLESFLVEVEEFHETVYHHQGKNNNSNNLKIMIEQHSDSFASFLEEKFLCQSLDKLNSSAMNCPVSYTHLTLPTKRIV